jgi:histidinol dehydrogenase
MRVLTWRTLSRDERAAALRRPVLESRADVRATVSSIIEEVRSDGDRALIRLTAKLDHVNLTSLKVPEVEYYQARRSLTQDQIAALERAVANVARFHEAQSTTPARVETEAGVRCEQIVRPIARVGLYAPSGSAPLPSALIMTGVPARIAGCQQRILCTPPRTDGTVHPAVLMVAQLCGIDTVFKVGGVQAIAALAYGTESIPKVDKIFGPGNAYVTAAKQQVAQDHEGASCDLPAGPSEVLIVADASASAAFVAADLLAQLEHDALSQAILITDSVHLARVVSAELREQASKLSRRAILSQSLQHCRCILVPDLDTAMDAANAYAPEHLILQVREPRRWLPYVHNAGSIFLGSWTPEALGDYCSGANHVLPTYGYARNSSGLLLRDFQKVLTVQEATPDGLRALGPCAVTLAELETLDAHAHSVSRRLEALRARAAGGKAADALATGAAL